MFQPLVSVICLCYNHKNYVERAVKSALEQSYRNIEVIIVDDHSTDGSQEVVKNLGIKYNLRTILLPENQGNCKAFNTGFSLSKGNYIIDLAADDVLLPDRVKVGAEDLEVRGDKFGVNFCNIELIDSKGKSLGTHFKRNSEGNPIEKVQDGDLYQLLLEKYYICTPTMMMRREVLEKLGGYDEDLSYEDFDFWIRSSREYFYSYTDRILMQKQVIANSHSAKQYQRKNPHCLSTLKVCEKAFNLNRTPDENRALLKRINYELKWALITENWEAASLFLKTKKKIPHNPFRLILEKFIILAKPPWYSFWKIFLK